MKVFAKADAPRGRARVAPGLAAGSRHASIKASGTGVPLANRILSQVEPRFAFNFSNVKVHADADAAAASRSLNARAFTVGHNVFFGAGEYRPETSGGQRLLTHELTHVVQQSRGGGAPGSGQHAAVEQDARRSADVYGSGPVRVQASSGIGIARAPLVSTDVSKLDADALEARAQALNFWFTRHLTDDPEYAAQLQAAVDVYQEISTRGAGSPSPVDTEALKGRLVAQSPRTAFELRIRRGELPQYKALYKDGEVVAYRRSSGGYSEIRDIEGTFVSSDEIGLETPLIDPIDLIPFELLGSLVAKAGAIGLRAAVKVGVKILAKDAAKVVIEEGVKVGTKEVVEGAAKAGTKELAKAGSTAAGDVAKAGAKDAAGAATKAGAGDLAKAEVKALAAVFRKGAKFKSVGAVSLKRLRNVLGRAGVSPSGYKLVKVSAEVSRALEKETGETVWGWVSRTGEGIVASDAKGRPIINFTERALSSLQEAVKTFGHEAAHLKDFAAGRLESSEALAEEAGEKLWLVVQESLGG